MNPPTSNSEYTAIISDDSISAFLHSIMPPFRGPLDVFQRDLQMVLVILRPSVLDLYVSKGLNLGSGFRGLGFRAAKPS